MEGRSNYRVQVDLSKYHQDARRFSWIYINSTNVWFISHLKRHIQEVFGINEPFHLLLNGDEYLPPAEDVRVLNENEVVVVEPGSGISNENENIAAMSLPSSDMENGFVKDISTTDEAAPYQHKTKHETRSVPQNENQNTNSSLANVSKADATMYHSILDVTEIESSSDSKQLEDDSICAHFGAVESHVAVPAHKRKRIRRKRVSKQAETSLNEIIDRHKWSNINKPKIVDSYTIPSGKHIRFDSLDERNDGANKIENRSNNAPSDDKMKTSFSVPSLPFFKSSKVEGLSSLLALKNCSSPLIFPKNKKRKYGNDSGSELQTENGDTVQSSNTSSDTPSLQSSASSSVNNIALSTDEGNKYSNAKLEEYPPLESVTEINDVIAFKVLRIGSEYTPEISGYIVAKTLDYCPKKMLYTFKILNGQAEIEGPSGKFSLPENEAEQDKSDTAQFNFSQLIEPRLISRK